MTREPEFIDLTPTWSGVLPILLASFENCGDEGSASAISSLKQMAEVADRHVAAVKEAAA
ncbi:MAG: hypothetical protein AB7I79_03225 [Rhizobiaceae bacterium]